MDLNQERNFLDPIFQTKIKCSCPVDDFHGVENLISSDQQQFQRGFMAYRVVKPPIELEISLCCCIELNSIKIWPQIDSLKSIGFEVFINSGDNLHSEFRKVATHFNLREYGIEFTCEPIDRSNDPALNFAVIPFYLYAKNQLRRTQTVKLVIKQTARCCVPVIKRIEIWGRVSKFASKEQRDNVCQAIERAAAAASIKCGTSNENSALNVNDTKIERNDSLSLTIPEAFLDAITCEIMALPMVLPSGKTIDNSTLLKHSEHEEKWGRVPSDPFTGQPYTDTRKPVLDVHLKSQIDSFLLKHCDVPEIRQLPRTVGSAPKRRLPPTEASVPKSTKIENSTASTSYSSQSYISSGITILPASLTPTSSRSPSSSSSYRTQSLDEAIRGVLKNCKYKTSSTNNLNRINSQKCFQCPEPTANNILYTIATCSHLICRNCLIEKNLSICKCGNGFSNIDVNKYNRRELL